MKPGQIYLDPDGTAYIVVRAREVGARPRWWIDRGWCDAGAPEDYHGPDDVHDLRLDPQPDDCGLALVLP